MYQSWSKRLTRSIRGQLRAAVLSNHGIGVVAVTQNGLLVVDPRDFGVARGLLVRGEYDCREIRWLLRVIDQESHIVFVGAHVGALLIPIAVRSGARNIVAFEPSPRNQRLLGLNLTLNGVTNVCVRPLAAGQAEGTVRFTENPLNTGNSRVSRDGEVLVGITTLDAALQAVESQVHLLVMDVEGYEVHVMRGATRALGRTRYLYTEYAPDQLIEQGSNTEAFIDVVTSHFDSMYVPGNPVRFFNSKGYVNYLRELSTHRGLVVNLLFCNDPRPDARLLRFNRNASKT